jgi:hypothetical protein
LPKEKAIKYLPKTRLLTALKKEMGSTSTYFNPQIKNLQDLVFSMRNSIANFNIDFISLDKKKFLIDRIAFKDQKKGSNYVVAEFKPDELLNFIRYYASWIASAIRKHKNEIYKLDL